MLKILAATDLSSRSDRAVRRADLLARKLSAQFTVLHVVDEELPAHIASQMALGAKELIAASLQATPPATAGNVAEVAVATGQDWRTIVNEADVRNCDLIILGTHRMTVTGFLHGCTMERVIRATHRPVLVVRDEPRAPYRTVMAAVDFSVASRYAVQAALSIAPDANLVLVHAYQVPLMAHLASAKKRDEMRQERSARFAHMVEEEMATFLGTIDRKPETITRILREGPSLEVIDAEVSTRNPDLLVLGTHGRTGAAVTLLGSVALAFLELPPCDVLVGQAW